MTNHEILGIKPGASKEEIKKAYHKMAHIHHPDKGGDPKKFIQIKNAYEAIIDSPVSTGWDPAYDVYAGGFTVTYTYKSNPAGNHFWKEAQQQYQAQEDINNELAQQQKILKMRFIK